MLAEQKRAEMFVSVSTHRARAGEEDAIIALHEDWQRHQRPYARGYLSGELLRNITTSREFLAIIRFESQESAQALTKDPERKAWSQHLASLLERLPVPVAYTSACSQTA